MKINVEFNTLGDMVNFADFVMNQSSIRVDKKKLEDYERMLANAQTQLERAYERLNQKSGAESLDIEFNDPSNLDGPYSIWFTNRTFNCLKSENIKTISDLVKFSHNELLKIPNLGRKSLKEVVDELAAHNLHLKG
jgi:DNA-directed RNA polymerase alpha subunit